MGPVKTSTSYNRDETRRGHLLVVVAILFVFIFFILKVKLFNMVLEPEENYRYGCRNKHWSDKYCSSPSTP